MSIIRSPRPESHFVVFANEIVRDSRLSYKARGILLEILSRPDNWRINADALASSGVDGRHAVLSGLKELRDLGYIITKRHQHENGQFETVSYVYDTPQVTPEAGNPTPDNPTSENPTPKEEPIKKNLIRKNSPATNVATADVVDFGDLGNAQTITASYVDAFRAKFQKEPPSALIKRIARDAKQMLINDSYSVAELSAAAMSAANSGHGNLPAAVARNLATTKVEPRGFSAIRQVLSEEGAL
jgi:hypothetical protein